MTSYAMRLTAEDRRGRQAVVWAVAPSPADAHALIAAYRAASDCADWEISEDATPVQLDGSALRDAGLDASPGSSRLFCLMRDAGAEPFSRTGR